MINAVWLALCSGPSLSIPDQRVTLPFSLPSDRSNYVHEITSLPGGLGWPENIRFYSESDHLISEFKVLRATNYLGRAFLGEFRMVYFPSRAGPGSVSTRADLMGHVTFKGAASLPPLPREAVENLK